MRKGYLWGVFLLFVFLLPYQSHAANGSIHGRVVNSSGVGITGMSVWAFTGASGACSTTYITSAPLGSDGNFTFDNNIPEGSNIYIQVGNANATSNYTSAWYKSNHIVSTPYDAYDCQNATPITVTAGLTAEIGNIILQAGGTVTGTVMDGSTPVGGTKVYVGNMFMPSGTACNSRQVTSCQVNANGTFTYYGVPVGTNYFRFSSSDPAQPYPNYYWDGSSGSTTCASGATVNVNAGANNAALNFQVAKGVKITGKVTNSGANLSGMYVSAVTGSPCSSWSGATGAFTDSNGDYSIVAPAGATYYVRADSTYNKLNYIPLWWNGSTGSQNCQNAQAISNPQPGASVTGVNFSVSPGGIVSGKLTDANSQAITSGTVTIYSGNACSGYTYVTSTSSFDSQGQFSVYGVPEGNVLIRATSSGHVSLWWDGAQGAPMCSSAQQKAVVTNQTTGNINFVMPVGGSLSGVVRDTNNAPIAGVYVSAFYGASSSSLGYAITDASGQYTIGSLPSGMVTVYAQGGSPGLNYDYRWWAGQGQDGTPYWMQAKPVSVVMPGDTASSIDFKLHSTGYVTGTVTDHLGNPLASVSVLAHIDPSQTSVAGTITAANGTYTLRGVPDGAFIHAMPANTGYNNVNSWYAGASLTFDPAKAKPLTLPAGATQTVNFQTAQGAIVSGTINDASTAQAATGVPVRIDVTGACGNTTVSQANTDSSGAFTLKGIPATSSARLGTFTSGPGYCQGWWDGTGASTNQKQAKAMSLIAGTTTSGITMSLTKGGVISGNVSAGGAPLQNVQVMALVSGACANPDQYINTRTDYWGNYTISGIPLNIPVSVRTDTSPMMQSYAPKWRTASGDTTDCAQATTYTLNSTTPVTNVDFSLSPGGSISGRITSIGSPVPCMNVYAWAGSACSGTFLEATGTDWQGNYTIYGLPFSTNVYVGTKARNMPYGDKYWDGVKGGSCVSAQAVSINPAQPAVTGVNLVLLKLSSLMSALMQLLMN